METLKLTWEKEDEGSFALFLALPNGRGCLLARLDPPSPDVEEWAQGQWSFLEFFYGGPECPYRGYATSEEAIAALTDALGSPVPPLGGLWK